MIAKGPDERGPEIFLHQVEIGLALPVYDVSGVDYVVDMLFRPSQCIPECFFLPASEGDRAFCIQFLLLGIFMGISGSEMGVGNMKD